MLCLFLVSSLSCVSCLLRHNPVCSNISKTFLLAVLREDILVSVKVQRVIFVGQIHPHCSCRLKQTKRKKERIIGKRIIQSLIVQQSLQPSQFCSDFPSSSTLHNVQVPMCQWRQAGGRKIHDDVGGPLVALHILPPPEPVLGQHR